MRKTKAQLDALPEKRTRREQERQQKHRQRQSKHKQEWEATHRKDRPSAVRTQPDLTPARAHDLVKLLAAGVPPHDALRYLDPEYFAVADPKQRHAWLLAWSGDPMTLRAQSSLNGADWPDLEAGQRLTIAFDKHLAELAYFLFSHDYSKIEGTDLRKADAAREALMSYLKEGADAESSPFKRFLEEFMAGRDQPASGQLVMPVAIVKES